MSDKIVITRPIMGLLYMQVCAHKDATDEEILGHANEHNPSGTEHGWGTVHHEGSEDAGLRPVQCVDDPERLHYILSC